MPLYTFPSNHKQILYYYMKSLWKDDQVRVSTKTFSDLFCNSQSLCHKTPVYNIQPLYYYMRLQDQGGLHEEFLVLFLKLFGSLSRPHRTISLKNKQSQDYCNLSPNLDVLSLIFSHEFLKP